MNRFLQYKDLFPEERPGQIEYIKVLDEQLTKSECFFLAEGGTGVGKSNAYIASAVKAITEQGVRVVCATANNNLLSQLKQSTLPGFNKYADFSSAVLKGRANYLCRNKWNAVALKIKMNRFDDLDIDCYPLDKEQYIVAFKDIDKWAEVTDDGDFYTIPNELYSKIIKDYTCSDCIYDACQNCCTGECFYLRAAEGRDRVSLVATNHHAVLTDLLKKNFLGNYSVLIVDEAHNFHSTFRDFLTVELTTASLFSIIFAINNISEIRDKLDLWSYKMYLNGLVEFLDSNFKTYTEDRDPKVIVKNCTSFFYSIQDSLLTIKAHLIGQQACIIKDILESRTLFSPELPFVNNIIDMDNIITDFMNGDEYGTSVVSVILNSIRERIADGTAEYQESKYFFLFKRIANIVDTVIQKIGHISNFLDIDKKYYEYVDRGEYNKRSGRTNYVFTLTPIDISKDFIDLHKRIPNIVFTSATIPHDGNNYSFIENTYGVTPTKTLVVPSPFDYPNRWMMYVAKDMPVKESHMDEDARANYIECLSKEIIEKLYITNGHSLVIFTSIADMKQTYDVITEYGCPYPIKCQIIDGGNKQLAEWHKSTPNSVLLAVNSFAEGYDSPGQQLCNIIITKLPFPEMKSIESNIYRIIMGDNWWNGYYTPIMVNKLKQAIGRGARTTKDFGIISLLDSRVCDHTKRYNTVVYNNLPHFSSITSDPKVLKDFYNNCLIKYSA